MRLNLWHLIPVLSVTIAGLFYLRFRQNRLDFVDLVQLRKPYDARILARSIEGISEDKKTTLQEQWLAVAERFKGIHRSTWVAYSESPGTYLIDNSNPTIANIVPEPIIVKGLDLWANSTAEDLYTKGISFNVDGVFYHVAVSKFQLLRNNQYIDCYAILITNLDRAITAPFTHNVQGLSIIYILLVCLITAGVASVLAPLYRIKGAIERGEKVKIDRSWFVEIAQLAEVYNDGIESARLASIQIEQSTSGQMLVLSSLDNEARIAKPNGALAKILGYSIEELERMPLNQICPDFAHEFHRGRGVWDEAKRRYVGTNAYPKGCPHMGNAKSTIVGTDRSVDLICNGGQIRTAILGVHLLSTDGNEHKYSAVLTDVTELKKIYRSLRHDIISGVGGILNIHNEMRESGFDPGKDFRDSFDLIEAKTRLVHRLVSNTGKLDAALSITDVSLTSIFNDLLIIFAENNVSCLKPSPDVIIKVDRDIFVLKILNNLITNAIKYSNSHNKDVTVGVKVKDNSIVIYVKDNGRGLTDKEISRVLSNYGQGARLQPEIEGTGTGLSTVQEYLKMLDLELKVKSKLGSGSLFYIEFPNTKYSIDDSRNLPVYS